MIPDIDLIDDYTFDQESLFYLTTKQTLTHIQALADVVYPNQKQPPSPGHPAQPILAPVIHDLHNPLTILLQAIEILENPLFGSLSEEQLNITAIMQRQVATLLQTLESLIQTEALLGQIGAVEPRLVNLDNIFDEVFAWADAEAAGRQIMLNLDMLTLLPACLVDTKYLKVALTQILTYAIQVTRPGGEIKIISGFDERQLTLMVTSHDIDLEAEQINHLWEMANAGTTPGNLTQTGLGFTLARYIIEAHGGTLDINTTFDQNRDILITLPLEDAKNHQTPAYDRPPLSRLDIT